MKLWSWHRTRVLLLAVLVGLGMSLSFVQSSVTAAKMTVAADGADHGPRGCDGCGGGDHKDINAGTCLAVCGFAAQGLVSGELLTLPSASQTVFLVADLLIVGQSDSPDHGPPKVLILG
jgi:hypothetical protein